MSHQGHCRAHLQVTRHNSKCLQTKCMYEDMDVELGIGALTGCMKRCSEVMHRAEAVQFT